MAYQDPVAYELDWMTNESLLWSSITLPAVSFLKFANSWLEIGFARLPCLSDMKWHYEMACYWSVHGVQLIGLKSFRAAAVLLFGLLAYGEQSFAYQSQLINLYVVKGTVCKNGKSLIK